MTTLDKLNILAMNIKSEFEDIGVFLAAYGLSGTEPLDATNNDLVWLAYADMLEVYASKQDYSQGEVNERIDRTALLEIVNDIRRRHSAATRSEFYQDEETGEVQ